MLYNIFLTFIYISSTDKPELPPPFHIPFGSAKYQEHTHGLCNTFQNQFQKLSKFRLKKLDGRKILSNFEVQICKQ